MPTKDFFSDPDSGRENTGGSRKPQEQDDPFAGMQKLNFDLFDQGSDSAGDALSFNALFDELPQEQPRSAQPAPGAAKAAPFIFDEQPSGTNAARQPKAAPAQRPAQPMAPAQRPAQPAAPAQRPAQPAAPPQRSAPPTRRAAQPAFDLSALEKEIDRQAQTSRPGELEGYAPLAFDFGDEPPRAAAPVATAAPAQRSAQFAPPSAPAAAPRPSAPQAPAASAASRPSAPQAPAASAAPRPSAPQAPAASAMPRPAETVRPAAPAATPFVVETQPSASPSAPAAAPRPYASQAPAAPAATRASAPTTAPYQTENTRPAGSPVSTPATAPRPAASPAATSAAAPRPVASPATTPAAAPRPAQPAASAPAARRPSAPVPAGGLAPGQGPARRSESRSADYSTISFSLGDVSVEAPTMAFMPIEQINSAASAQAEANRRAAEKSTSTPPPVQSADARAARMAKERNIGAAVFSALMEQDAPPASAARSASAGGASRAPAATMEWPAAPRTGDAARTPKPINWRMQSGTAGTGTAAAPPVTRPEPQPAAPTPAAPAPQPAPAAPDDGLTPLDFNFDDIDSFGAAEDTPVRQPRRSAEFLDLYEPDPDDQPARRPRSGRSSGSGAGHSPRKPSGAGKGSVPTKTIFAWCGILLIAVLVILLFVVFGDKDEDSSSSSSGSSAASISDQQQGESMPTEPAAVSIPRDEWYMVLANRNSVLPEDFTVEQTETVGEALVDARIAESLRQMVNDAAAAGIRLKPTNGYRSVTRQKELWEARVQKLMTEDGMSKADAEVRALDFTSRAGTSDHNTGLGLDIVSEDHPAKDMAYADTAAAAWLQEHAADYGFILRYPSDKTDATGMNFEPWHYRYVGVEQAQLIKASGLCLEEYLAQ